MAHLRTVTWSFTLAEMLYAWCALLLVHYGAAALAMESTEGRLVRRESEESVKHAPDMGRWLFGSLSRAEDILPIDEMLPHQLRNLANKGFDHVILYTSNKGSDSNRKKQAEALDHIRLQGMVSEFVDVDKLKMDFESARPVIHKSAAEKLFGSDGHKADNKALVDFLTRCILEYDHCAWLDSDIFVHRGAAAWMELSVQDAVRNPSLAISLPSFGRFTRSIDSFTSRHYVYHAKQMNQSQLLPLTDSGGVPDSFERFLQWKIDSLSKDSKDSQASNPPRLMYQTRSPNTWVMHPPNDYDSFKHIMTRCSSTDVSLKAVLLIVEKGHHTRTAESPTFWRKAESLDGLYDMDAEKWGSRVEEYCAKALKSGEASQLARQVNDGKLHQWRPSKTGSIDPPRSHREAAPVAGPAAKPHFRLGVEDLERAK